MTGRPLVFIAILILSGCSPSEEITVTSASREIIDGYELVRVSGLNSVEPVILDPVLSIGSEDGDDPFLFGTIKGVNADSEGNIYILDSQASELRVFSPEGQYLKTIGQSGVGPGEIDEANGFTILPDDTIWLYDHGQWRVKVFNTEGEEVESHPPVVMSYGWLWSGTVDHKKQIWKGSSMLDENFQRPPKDGFNETAGTAFMIAYDTLTERADTTWLGRVSGMYYSITMDRGFRNMGLMYSPSRAQTVSPFGDGFWKAAGYDYEFARLNRAADTTMIVKTDLVPVPVTQDDRDRYIDAVGTQDQKMVTAANEIAGKMPEYKPAIQGIVVDDDGDVWITRYADAGELTTIDSYSPNGEFLKSFHLNVPLLSYFPPRIKDGRVYALAYREDGVPSIVVFEL